MRRQFLPRGITARERTWFSELVRKKPYLKLFGGFSQRIVQRCQRGGFPSGELQIRGILDGK